MKNLDNTSKRSVWHLHVGMTLFWVLVLSLLYIAMSQYLEPKAAVVQADRSLHIERQKDGHFYADGSIDGQAVRFLIDTGASYIAITDGLAQRAGLLGGERAQFQTANGVREGRLVRVQMVSVGPLRVQRLTVGTGYTAKNVNEALLGQNFLRQFDVRIRGDLMVIQALSDTP